MQLSLTSFAVLLLQNDIAYTYDYEHRIIASTKSSSQVDSATSGKGIASKARLNFLSELPVSNTQLERQGKRAASKLNLPPCESSDFIYVDFYGCLPKTTRNQGGETMVYVHNNILGDFPSHNSIANGCGGFLASILSAKEQTLVESQLSRTDKAWIGGQQPQPCDDEPAGCWEWIDGSSFEYMNWNRGEPNQLGPENCLEIVLGNNKWNDLECNDVRNTGVYLLPLGFQVPSCRLQISKPSATASPSTAPSPYRAGTPTVTPTMIVSTLEPSTASPTSKACPPYDEDRALSGCGDPTIDATLLPSSGPEVGGTVIQITNIKYCLNEGVNVYCRFKSSVVAGIRVNDSTIECISPPSNGASSTEVSYAMFIPGCHYDPAEARWNVVSESFDYYDNLAGVVLTPTFGNNENTRLMFAERQYNVEWNSDALLLSAIASNAIKSSLKIDLEVVAYFTNDLNQDLYFQVVQTLKNITPKDTNTIKLAVSDEAISPAINSYVDGIKKVGFAVVRIVAYTKTSQGVHLVHATRTSKLIGVLPEGTDTSAHTCPVAPFDFCNQNTDDVTPPCPPTYSYAKNDFDFYPDETCIYPSGGDRCSVASDLDEDHLETCREFEDHPDFLEYCEGIDFDTNLSENCNCNYFHFGAAGCIRNGQSQCCYTTSGGLIMDPSDGGGTKDCSGDFLNHFLHDILPYIYCCKLNDDCDTYYAARPSISDDNYDKPQLPVFTFGDPHLESFDRVNFDFNGFGEYIAFCGVLNSDSVATNIDKCQPASNEVLARGDTTSVHFRFVRLEANHNGTVTVGVAIEDPTFKKGKQALAVVTHPSERLVVYDGSNIVKFPKGKKKKNRKKKKKISGATLFMTPVTTLPDFEIRVTLKSGLMLRIRENGFGVMTVGFLKRPVDTEKHVGLLGTPDDDGTNDFTAANGTVLDVSAYEPLAKGYETIFHDFGKTWMVPQKESSLFQDLTGSNDFNNFHFPDYLPSFAYNFTAEADTNFVADIDCNEDICGKFKGYLKQSCCFDYEVTRDVELVKTIMIDAEKEDKIRTILNNTIPVIEGGGNRSITVEMGESVSFDIRTYDEDGDIVTTELERSDRGFVLTDSADSADLSRLSFAGNQLDGTWRAQVGISDGNSTVLFTATVNVNPPPCVNDKHYRYQGNKKKSCVWVGADESRRQDLCSAQWDEVRVACRMTCGLCCKDNPRFKYVNNLGSRADCAWTGKKAHRAKKYCKRKKVASNCPVTCKTCQDKFMCINNGDFRLNIKKDKGSCAWIGSKESRRLKNCVQTRVRVNCPTSCGLCCEDNRNYLFKSENGSKKGCDWIKKQPSRISKYCPKAHISANCPAKTTCNSCKVFVDPN